ncbi:cation transporter [Ferrovum sp.]|uniref:cation transporter n=2 Tax=Ferrovum sp. TaxID=2609467 RepID=UPI00261F70AA|nr:cation transporter [Ferrovum sp.]
MSTNCCNSACAPQTTLGPRYRKALWIALIINVAMFAVEIGGGLKSGSVSLFADAVDFAGDAANYGISLAVLSMGLAWKSRAALVKGASMGAFGLFILGKTGWAAIGGLPPEPSVMGAIAVLALFANGGVALMLYAFRNGDANMRSVWLCSRNDAIGNIAVMVAAAGVFGTGTAWPDLAVALLMGGLALSSGISVIGHARQELVGEVA